jgi:ornithine racemase
MYYLLNKDAFLIDNNIKRAGLIRLTQKRSAHMPYLNIFLPKISNNLNIIKEICDNQRKELVVVTKSVQSNQKIVDFLHNRDIKIIADVYKDNLEKVDSVLKKMLFIIPVSSINMSLEKYEYVFASELELIKRISELPTAEPQKVLIPLEIGDLREGIMPSKIISFVKKVLKHKGVKIAGLTVNFGCMRGLLPDEQKIDKLLNIYNKIQEELDIKLDILSVGGSVIYYMLRDGKLPPEVNQVRIGEAIFFGREPGEDMNIEGMYQDTFVFSAEIMEIKDKDTDIGGNFGYNAFGERIEPEGHGIRKRALLNFGELITTIDGLTPIDEGIELIGCTHDHSIIDITESNQDWQVGDMVDFYANYNATSHLMLSDRVEKRYKVLDSRNVSPFSLDKDEETEESFSNK